MSSICGVIYSAFQSCLKGKKTVSRFDELPPELIGTLVPFLKPQEIEYLALQSETTKQELQPRVELIRRARIIANGFSLKEWVVECSKMILVFNSLIITVFTTNQAVMTVFGRGRLEATAGMVLAVLFEGIVDDDDERKAKGYIELFFLLFLILPFLELFSHFDKSKPITETQLLAFVGIGYSLGYCGAEITKSIGQIFGLDRNALNGELIGGILLLTTVLAFI